MLAGVLYVGLNFSHGKASSTLPTELINLRVNQRVHESEFNLTLKCETNAQIENKCHYRIEWTSPKVFNLHVKDGSTGVIHSFTKLNIEELQANFLRVATSRGKVHREVHAMLCRVVYRGDVVLEGQE
jgi:hypothetical protein